MNKKRKKERDIRPIVYLAALVLMIGCFYVCFYERPQKSKMEFAENDKPGKEQLFVPIKEDVAVELFEEPVIKPDVILSVQVNNDILIIEGEELEEILDLISMRSTAMWKELQQIDSKLSLSDDCQTLKLGIYTDEKLRKNYVNVPAGFLRAYIK